MIDARMENPPDMDKTKNEDIESLKKYLYRQVETINIAMNCIQEVEDRLAKLEKIIGERG